MKRRRKEWTTSYYIAYRSIIILMLSGLPFLLASCTDGLINSQKTPYSGPKVAVQFSFGGVVDKGNEVVTRSGSSVSEEETVVIPLADDLYMYATLEVDQTVKTRAATSDLEPGTRVRIVAYLNGDTYHTHADYTVSNSQELTGDLLGVKPFI